MSAALYDFTLFENDDFVTVSNRAQAVGDDNTRTAAPPDVFDHVVFSLGVQGARRLIHNKDRWIVSKRPCDLESLSLAATHINRAF